MIHCSFFTRLMRDEQGATAIEYGLILALLTVAILVSLQGLGSSISSTWNTVSSQANNATAQAVGS